MSRISVSGETAVRRSSESGFAHRKDHRHHQHHLYLTQPKDHNGVGALTYSQHYSTIRHFPIALMT